MSYNIETVINVRTQEEFDTLMEKFRVLGLAWYNGDQPGDQNEFDSYRNETCVRIDHDGLVYGDEPYYRSDPSYRIISLQDYMREEEDTKQTCIYVRTIEEYRSLMQELERVGYRWNGSDEFPTAKKVENLFDHHEKFTVYLNTRSMRLTYGHLDHAVRYQKKYNILTYNLYMGNHVTQTTQINLNSKVIQAIRSIT